MGIKGIGHLAFTVSDLDRALEFYCGVLGFEKLFDLNFDDGDTVKNWITYLKIADKQFIELFTGGKDSIEYQPTNIGYSHLSLEVSDIHEITEHVRKAGITIDTEPQRGADGNMQSWIRDPDGNRIEFMQYGETAAQLQDYKEPASYNITPDRTIKRVK